MKYTAARRLTLPLALLVASVATAQERPQRGTPAPNEAPEVQEPARTPARTPGARTPGARTPADAQPDDQKKRRAPSTEVNLAQARRTFTGADADKSGRLDAAEALVAGLGPKRVAAADFDGEAGLSSDEFVVAFQRKASAEGQVVAQDLVSESARITGARARSTAGNQKGQANPAGPTHEEKLKAILDTLNRRVRNGDLTQADALATYASMSRRLDNALLGAAAQQNGLAKVEFLAQVKESLNARVRNGNLSDADALAVYGRVADRIDQALAQAGVGDPQTSDPATRPVGAPAGDAPAPGTSRAGTGPAPSDPAATPEPGTARRPRRAPDAGDDANPPGGVRRARRPADQGSGDDGAGPQPSGTDGSSSGSNGTRRPRRAPPAERPQNPPAEAPETQRPQDPTPAPKPAEPTGRPSGGGR